jgi:hypothetical protein
VDTPGSRADNPEVSDDRKPGWWAAERREIEESFEDEVYLPRAWRLSARVLLAAAVAVVLTLAARYNFADPLPTAGNVEVVARLDDFTRKAGDAGNTIPAFLALPGAVGVVEPSAPAEQPVRSLDETELRRGFCSASLPLLIRHEYPGFYDRWSDARLERAVLQEHPEYRDRVCAVAVWLDADPDAIVKYQMRPRSVFANAGLLLWTTFLTAAFAAALLVVYYRFVVVALTAR